MLTEMSGICSQLIPHITQVTSAGSDQLLLHSVLILKFSPEPGKQTSLFQITTTRLLIHVIMSIVLKKSRCRLSCLIAASLPHTCTLVLISNLTELVAVTQGLS